MCVWGGVSTYMYLYVLGAPRRCKSRLYSYTIKALYNVYLYLLICIWGGVGGVKALRRVYQGSIKALPRLLGLYEDSIKAL
jgi:hypothetical protein